MFAKIKPVLWIFLTLIFISTGFEMHHKNAEQNNENAESTQEGKKGNPSAAGAFGFALICAYLTYRSIRKNWLGKNDRKAKGIYGLSVPKKLSPAQQAIALSLTDGADKAINAIQALPKVQKAKNKDAELQKTVKKEFPFLVAKAMEDKVLTEQEEKGIANLVQDSGLTWKDFPDDLVDLISKAGLIRDLCNGIYRPRFDANSVAFNFEKSEKLVWFCQWAELFEERTAHEWEGGSQGFNVRLAKGVYYRVGKTRAQRVQRKYHHSLGKGILAVTTKHLYFKSASNALKIDLYKIIGINLYSDAVQVFREGSKALPLLIYTEDPWMLANCMSNAKNWA